MDENTIDEAINPLLQLKDMSFNEILNTIGTWAVDFAGRLIAALVLYLVGRWLIRRVSKMMARVFGHRELDKSLANFLKSTVKIALNVILIIMVITTLGVKTSSIVALIASAGVAIGMALSGTLQNFAGGVMILLLRPFKVGDYIEAQGQQGTVREIQIFNTILATIDNKIIFIPNGSLSTGIMKNYSREPLRRVDWTFTIAYGQDYDRAKEVVSALLVADTLILTDPAPYIALDALADNSVNLTVRVWVKTEDYWTVYHRINELLYKSFSKEGINIPFPQLDVHIKNS